MPHEHNPQSDGADKTSETNTGSGVGGGVRRPGWVGGAGRVGALARPSLIPNWRRSWRMLTIQIAGAAVLFGALPVDQQSAILSLLGIGPERIPALLGLAVIVARLVQQPKVSD